MSKRKRMFTKNWQIWVSFLSILIGIILRITVCFKAFGIWWKGDEAEYVNMAWLMVHGYGWSSLDLRSPFYSMLLAIPIKTASLFNIYGNNVMLISRLFNSIFSIILIFSFYALATKICSERVATVSTILISFSAPIIEWTPRVMTEIPSVSFLILSLMVAIHSLERNSLPLMLISGALLGFSYLLRFNYVVFTIPLLVYLLVLRKRYLACGMILGFLLAFVLGGVLDYIVWGSFFHAPIRFLEVNVIAGFEHTDLDLLYYIRNMAWYVTPIGTILIPISLRKNKETLFLLGLTGSYLSMISLTPNYDLRYGLALVPFIVMLMANGLSWFDHYLRRISSRFPRTKIITALLPSLMLIAMICLSLIQTLNAPYVYNSNATKAALYLNNQLDVKGLITIDYACKMGEYIYLQKNVPIYEYTNQDQNVLKSFCQNANYIIVITEWYLQNNPVARETIRNCGFIEIQRYDEVYILKKY